MHAAPLFWLYNASTIKLSEIDLFTIGIFTNKAHIILVEQGNLTLTNKEGLVEDFETGNICITKGLDSEDYSLVASEGTVIHYLDFNRFLSEIYNHDYLIDYLL